MTMMRAEHEIDIENLSRKMFHLTLGSLNDTSLRIYSINILKVGILEVLLQIDKVNE